jgi:transposase
VRVNETVLKEECTEITEDIIMKDILEDEKEKYKLYGQNAIKRLITLMQENGYSVANAAQYCGIPRSSAYKLYDEWNKGEGSAIPSRVSGKKELKERTGRKLKEEHTMFIIELIDKKPSIVLEQVRYELCDQFADLKNIYLGCPETYD